MNSVVPISNPAIDPRQRSYQELKAKIHNDLLNRLNLERLTQMGQKEASRKFAGSSSSSSNVRTRRRRST